MGVHAQLRDGAPMALIVYVRFFAGEFLGGEWRAAKSLLEGQKAAHPCAQGF